MGSDWIIEAENLKFRYPSGVTGVESIDLSLEKGEKVAIIGPNGSGKTTLLELLGGLLEPEEGSVKYFGRETIDDYELRRRIGVLLQNPDDVLFNATVREDLEYGPRQMELPDEETLDEVIEKVGELLDLKDKLNTPPFKLSRGQKQRAAIGSVLTMKPEALLLDEPFSTIDLESRKTLLNHIDRLNSEGVSFVIAAHDLDIVPHFADRIYLLNGEIVKEGSMKEILTSVELLKGNGLRPPRLVQLGKKISLNPPPLTVSEAVEKIQRKFKPSMVEDS